ncbi:MAG: chemotaxis protein CheD [Pseudomonadota bacterium]
MNQTARGGVDPLRMIVGMADMGTGRVGDELVTYSLGSCIAVAAVDLATGVGGLLHFMLPESRLDRAKAVSRPCMFADTGISKLLNECERLGAMRRRLVIKLAGGAQVLDKCNFFNVGERNYQAAKNLLQAQGLVIDGEDVGGSDVRTVEMQVSTGRVAIKLFGNRARLL